MGDKNHEGKVETWQYEALKEIQQRFYEEYDSDHSLFKSLVEENKTLYNTLLSIGSLRKPVIIGENAELRAFIKSILQQLVFVEPMLYRIFLYIATVPEDIESRKRIVPKYLNRESVGALYDLLFSQDVLAGTHFAKSMIVRGRPLTSVPVRFTIVGSFLYDLFQEFEHFNLIDKIKEMGESGAIEELRNNRIYKSDEGIVFDYYPLFRKIRTGSGLVLEYFTENDYKKAIENSAAIDKPLIAQVQKSKGDARQDEFYGKKLGKADYVVVFRNRGQDGTLIQEHQVWFQLMPKYANVIRAEAKKHTLTKYTEQDNRETALPNLPTDELQHALLGLYSGVMTYDEKKGIPASHLSNHIGFELGHAFEKLSTTYNEEERREADISPFGTDKFTKNAILKEEVDTSGGSLDEPASDEETDETRKDFITGDDLAPLFYPLSNNAEKLLIEAEDTKKRSDFLAQAQEEFPQLKEILTAEQTGTPLTPKQRKAKERIIKKLKKRI